MTEKLEGVSAVYVADNGEGAVYIVDDKMVAVDKDGQVVSAVSDDVKQIVETAAVLVSESSMEEIDLTQYENVPKNILKAYKTASGNYVFDIRASGYGINAPSYAHASGEYIYITVSITADGVIIDCLTTAQSESTGIGDACANEDFYGQFDGKTEENYADVDAISGATITSDGYKKAIGNVFKALKILEGDAE
jgi:Na+-transporting NADH:ubiquinone oxidoreductase subunit NqrC